MTAATIAPRRALSWGAVAIVLTAAAGVIGLSLATPYAPITVGAAIAVAVVGLALADPRRAVVAAVAFALVMGVARRGFDGVFSDAGAGVALDPLLAVLPLITVVLTALAIGQGALRDRSPLATTVLGVCLLGTVGALNPLQGALVAWPLGLLIFLTPILWFWIGRGLVDDRTARAVLLVVLAVAIASAVYGLAQTAGWFLSFDQEWLDSLEGYVTIRVSSFVRGFGFANSAAEYGKLLGAGAVIATAVLLRRRTAVVGVVLPLIGAALFLSGLRTTLVLTVVAMGVIWGAHRGASAGRLLAYGAAALVVLFLVATAVAPGERTRSDAASVLAQRQVTGLSDPLDPRSSTLGTHADLVLRALGGTVTDPLGSGTATITIAGKRFGTSEAGDMDIADAAIAFGVIGVVVYLLLAVRLARAAYEVARRRRDVLALAVLGVTVVSSLQWLNGGLYGANAIAWCLFGWLDRAGDADRPSPTEASVAEPTT